MAVARVVTPNLPELHALSTDPKALAASTGAAILIKGGHAEGAEVVDRLIEPNGHETEWRGARIETRHSHGTGCTLASAIATGLGGGMAMPDAITRARAYVRRALQNAPGFGAGHGPMGFLPEA